MLLLLFSQSFRLIRIIIILEKHAKTSFLEQFIIHWNIYVFAILVQMHKNSSTKTITMNHTYCNRCIFISMVSLIIDDSCVNAKLVFLQLLPIHKGTDIVISCKCLAFFRNFELIKSH